ncbi:MAG TPA: exodeoxyribonuclease VII small subunit [Lachnospiraceae bacterium]|nr:exodeoxyribonuclease VII small subunit [Lachnospiraceae bacterium]
MAKKTFEEAMERLNIIVNEMESEETGLDASVKLYKEGVELAVFCKKQLDNAKKAVSLLHEKTDGSFSKSEFEVNDNDIL